MLPKPLLALLAGALASSPLAECHSFHGTRDGRLQRRVAAGGKCGPSAGNAVCNNGLCCSEGGVCGTGGEFCAAPGCQLSFGPACDGNQIPSGEDTSSIPRPRFGNVPYGVDITECVNKGQMALTFDDGPYIYTSQLLDVLKANDARATFFITGNNGAKGQIHEPSSGYPPIIRRMVAEGHQVGSHTWSHQDLELITAEQRRAQIINNEIAIKSILGVIPTYFRPPYTSCGGACYGDLGAFGYHVVNYDLDTKDYENGGASAKQRFNAAVNSGTSANTAWITLAHDIQEFTVVQGFAQWMIDTAKGLGYELVTVGECLGDAPANWYRDPATGAPRDIRGGSQPPVQRPVVSSSESSTTSEPTIAPSSVSNPNFGAAATHNSTIPSQTSGSSGVPASTADPTTAAPAATTSPSSAASVDRASFGISALMGLVLGVVGMGFMVVA